MIDVENEDIRALARTIAASVEDELGSSLPEAEQARNKIESAIKSNEQLKVALDEERTKSDLISIVTLVVAIITLLEQRKQDKRSSDDMRELTEELSKVIEREAKLSREQRERLARSVDKAIENKFDEK